MSENAITTEFDVIIEPKRRNREYWKDLWRYHELLFFLTQRNILIRYKQAVIGVAWALVRPLSLMLVFAFVFKSVAGFPSGDVPYFLFVLAALLPWQLLASSLADAGNSLVTDAQLISKVYFPRLLVPLSAIGANVVDFLASSLIFALMLVLFYHPPGVQFLFFPFFLVLCFLLLLGSGIWLSALTAKYRDFRHLVPFLLQIGLYISPIGYDSAMVPEKWRGLYMLNPVVGIVDGFRYSLFGRETGELWDAAVYSGSFSLILLITGIAYFRSVERTVADEI